MLTKPTACNGCPLKNIGTGFSRIETASSGSQPILIFGEALGESEAKDGLPFRPYAASGAMLMRALRKLGVDRGRFNLFNIVNCQPPHNVLRGAGYEKKAISHCAFHRDRAVNQVQPAAILALGDVALETLSGLSGKNRSISKLRGYVLPTAYGVPMIASYHPSFLQRGKSELLPVLMHDIKKVVELAEGRLVKDVDYVLDPTSWKPGNYCYFPSVTDAWAYYEILRMCPEALIAYDIETDQSFGMMEDDPDIPLNTGYITQIQFSEDIGKGVVLPWTGGYIDVAKAILALPNPKAGHNSWKFDDPILRAVGCTINGQLHDTLWAWHHLQPDLPANLQFVAGFYGFPFPWKHYSESDKGFYGACDVDAVQYIMARVLDDHQRMGIEYGYERHVVALHPILERMQKRGVPVSQTGLDSFQASVNTELANVETAIQAKVPPEILGCEPKNGYVREPKDTTGMVKRTFKVGITDPTTLAVNLVDVERWTRPKKFLPNSAKQLKDYMKAKGHTIPSTKDKDETTAAREIERLAKKTKDPLYSEVAKWRKLNHMLTTFIPGWTPASDGRVHSTFYFAPGTGQLSSRNPNVQNAPKRGELAKRFRAVIEAKLGHTLLEFDYHAFHALTLGFEAGDPDYMRLAKLDIHSYLTAHLLRLPEASTLLDHDDATLAILLATIANQHKDVRNYKAKPTILGYGFGLGPTKLYEMNQEYMSGRSEAKNIIDMLNALFPKVAMYRDEVRRMAHQQSFLLSKHGYIRRFYDVYHWDQVRGMLVPGADSEAAIAFLPANDAFGRIKEAMLTLEDNGANAKFNLINQIHDSLLYECPDALIEECVHTVKPEMEKPSQFLVNPEVPAGLVCEVSTSAGKKWSEMKEILI